ncbi:hypothetical protein HK098_007425 [Nowakowskiella sp. JEL0407]|nr:hypothetical protein HK098_007425 [Nowakowskiella sp. JEL0407]
MTGFNVALLKELARRDLVNVLDSVRGKKGLVIDQSLSGPISLVTEFSLLKDHGVEKIYHLQQSIVTECKALIYLCRPKIQNMKCIAENIRSHTQAGIKLEYSLFFVPRRTMICERVLEEEGVYGDISIGEYHLDIIPLDDDVISMELDNSFRELFLDGDTSAVYYVAKSIMKLQTLFGIIPRIVAKGNCSKLLVDLLLRMRRELGINSEDSDDNKSSDRNIFPASSEIDSLIIMDRTVDLVTPMCTQLTYEGLIDEKFGIRSTFVELDPSMHGPTVPPSGSSAAPAVSNKPRKVALNSQDKLFAQLRDLNFAVVGGLLSQVARRIHEDYEGRHQAKTVSQIKDFVGKLGNLQAEHQSARLHTNVAEEITKFTLDQDFNRMLEVQQNFVAGVITTPHIDYIEELINKQAPLMHVLRLLCLHSLVNGGFKPKQFDFFRRELIQTYGYTHILTLQNLFKTGLLRRQETARNPYAQIRKPLRLIVDEVNEHQPNDISYVYSGYAPISVRLVQLSCYKNVGNSAPAPVVAASPVEHDKIERQPTGLSLVAAVVGGNAGSVGQAAQQQQGNNHPVPSWKGWEESLQMLPGLMVEEVQKPPPNGWLAKRNRAQPKLTMVLFLGGCTFTEMSAIRFLAQQDEGQREFVIMTTNILNGSTLLESLADPIVLS